MLYKSGADGFFGGFVTFCLQPCHKLFTRRWKFLHIFPIQYPYRKAQETMQTPYCSLALSFAPQRTDKKHLHLACSHHKYSLFFLNLFISYLFFTSLPLFSFTFLPQTLRRAEHLLFGSASFYAFFPPCAAIDKQSAIPYNERGKLSFLVQGRERYVSLF